MWDGPPIFPREGPLCFLRLPLHKLLIIRPRRPLVWPQPSASLIQSESARRANNKVRAEDVCANVAGRATLHGSHPSAKMGDIGMIFASAAFHGDGAANAG